MSPEGTSRRSPENLQKEVDHLARVLKQNGYPANFLPNASALPTQETTNASTPDEGQVEKKGPLVSGCDTSHGWDE